MREGWTIMTIGEVALHLCDGSHNPPVGIDFSEYPMLSSKNIFFDSYDYSEPRYLTKEQFDIENKRTNVSDGDILLTIVGTIGRVCCIKEPFQPFTLQRSVAVIKPNKNIIISRYLMYCLCGLNAYFNKEAKGVAQKGIYLKQLSKISIPVPPLQEQERIVAELDLLTEIIDKQKQQLKELDTLAQSIFYDMFGNPDTNSKGWLVKKLGELCKSDLGKTLNASKDTGKMRPYLCAINIHWNEIDLRTLKQTKFEDEELERYSVVKGDLLVCEGGDVGRSAIWKEDRVIQYQNALHRIRFGKEIIAIYCLFVLQYLKVNGILDGRYGKGVTIKHLVKSSLLSIPIPVPPIEFQREFADKIQSIESQKQSINRSIAESQKLFDYTMDKYFG